MWLNTIERHKINSLFYNQSKEMCPFFAICIRSLIKSKLFQVHSNIIGFLSYVFIFWQQIEGAVWGPAVWPWRTQQVSPKSSITLGWITWLYSHVNYETYLKWRERKTRLDCASSGQLSNNSYLALHKLHNVVIIKNTSF